MEVYILTVSIKILLRILKFLLRDQCFFVVVANCAYSVLTQYNKRQPEPDAAFCFMSGATPRQSGTDVMILKIVLPKHLAFFAQITASFWKKVIITFFL
jgi:hypothetical protein